jgi:hypothetical protein
MVSEVLMEMQLVLKMVMLLVNWLDSVQARLWEQGWVLQWEPGWVMVLDSESLQNHQERYLLHYLLPHNLSSESHQHLMKFEILRIAKIVPDFQFSTIL